MAVVEEPVNQPSNKPSVSPEVMHFPSRLVQGVGVALVDQVQVLADQLVGRGGIPF